MNNKTSLHSNVLTGNRYRQAKNAILHASEDDVKGPNRTDGIRKHAEQRHITSLETKHFQYTSPVNPWKKLFSANKLQQNIIHRWKGSKGVLTY